MRPMMNVIGLVWFLALLGSVSCRDDVVDEGNCGRFSPRMKVRILGGEDTKIDESFKIGRWPSMAAIYKGKRFQCAGTLIRNDFVLTSASCVPESGDNYYVYLGLTDLQKLKSRSDSSAQRVHISQVRVIKHPKWDGASNDIALLKLKREAALNVRVEPACVPLDNDFKGNKYKMLGWGSKKRYSEAHSQLLQELLMPRISLRKCKQAFPLEDLDSANHICVGYDEGDKGACKRDSGAPLLGYDGHWFVEGIVTLFSDKCDSYVVATKVSAHAEWIKEVLENGPHEFDRNLEPYDDEY